MGSHRVLQWQHRFLREDFTVPIKATTKKEKQDSTWCSKPFNLSAKFDDWKCKKASYHLNITQPNIARWSRHSFLVHFCAGNLAPNLGVSTHGHAGKPKPDQFGMAMPGYLEDHPSSKPWPTNWDDPRCRNFGFGRFFFGCWEKGQETNFAWTG